MRLRRSEGVAGEKKLGAYTRIDRRTKNLIPRLQPGDIAVINHEDLDRLAAEGLVAAKVSAVLNASQSMSGRYPALGALALLQAGVPLIDGIGVGVFNGIHEGDRLSIVDDRVYMNGEAICRGSRPTLADLERRLELAREAVRGELGQFAANTLQYLATEPELITEDLTLPELSVTLSQRQILIVVRGIDYREDLAALRRTGYMRDMQPVLIGVDGGGHIPCCGEKTGFGT